MYQVSIVNKLHPIVKVPNRQILHNNKKIPTNDYVKINIS